MRRILQRAHGTRRHISSTPLSRSASSASKTLRKAFVMSVNEGEEGEYESRHRPIWPELEETLKQHGVKDYSIFMHPYTRQLFAYAEIRDEEQWSAIAETEICKKWWAHMKDVMPTNPDNSPVAIELDEVFHIDDKDG